MASPRKPRKKKNNSETPEDSTNNKEIKQTPPSQKQEEPFLTPEQIKEQRKLLLQSAALAYQLNEQTALKEEVEHLIAIVSEYLSPFMIVGYDTKGSSLVITSTKNMLEEDALLEAVKNAYGSYINKLRNAQKDTDLG